MITREDIINQWRSDIIGKGLKANYDTLVSSARNIQISKSYLECLFPDKMNDVLVHIHNLHLESTKKVILGDDNYNNMRFSQKIEFSLYQKLKIISNDQIFWRALIRYLLRPYNVSIASRILWKDVDSTIHTANDDSVDFTFYTKRGTLFIIYVSTIIHWMRTKDIESSMEHVRKCIEKTKKIGKFKKSLRGFGSSICNLVFRMQK